MGFFKTILIFTKEKGKNRKKNPDKSALLWDNRNLIKIPFSISKKNIPFLLSL
jgi:hypothetical protein